jgi:hypothetical protein
MAYRTSSLKERSASFRIIAAAGTRIAPTRSMNRSIASFFASCATRGRFALSTVSALLFLTLQVPNGAAAKPQDLRSSTPRRVTSIPGFRSLMQPTFTTCGQTSVAMVTGVDVKSVIHTIGTDRQTNAGQLVKALRRLRPHATPKVVQLGGNNPRSDSIVFLTDTSSGGGHWTVFHNGTYYDPIFGRLDAYPSWIRKRFAISVN